MQIRNSKLCEASKCRVHVYSTVNHPWCRSMLFHRRSLLWLVSAARNIKYLSLLSIGIFLVSVVPQLSHTCRILSGLTVPAKIAHYGSGILSFFGRFHCFSLKLQQKCLAFTASFVKGH